ncbi:MAG: hypothetical protein M3Z08_03090 [Chloroflexota bacterium]|nr:hypothetical protein [Chloroflexota bacterium]
MKVKSAMNVKSEAVKSEIEVTSAKPRIFSRQPLSTLGKTAVAALVGMIILCGLMSFFSVVLLITTVIVLLGTILVALGIRWAPLLGILMSGYMLYVFLIKESFPVYHLIHPKDAYGPGNLPALSFGIFVIIVLILWCAIVALGASTAALIQNYRQVKRQRPRWFASTLTGLTGVLVGVILIATIIQPTTVVGAATTSTNGTPTVHLGISSFIQSSVTVPKGSKLILVDDGSFEHILANGSWQNGQPAPITEPGAPTIKSMHISGGSVTIGPFATAGTYHIYCSVHQGMTLTIIVQ